MMNVRCAGDNGIQAKLTRGIDYGRQEGIMSLFKKEMDADVKHSGIVVDLIGRVEQLEAKLEKQHEWQGFHPVDMMSEETSEQRPCDFSEEKLTRLYKILSLLDNDDDE
jgi:hypothetical protein